MNSTAHPLFPVPNSHQHTMARTTLRSNTFLESVLLVARPKGNISKLAEKGPGSSSKLKITLEAGEDFGLHPDHLSWKTSSQGQSQHTLPISDLLQTAGCSSMGCDQPSPGTPQRKEKRKEIDHSIKCIERASFVENILFFPQEIDFVCMHVVV